VELEDREKGSMTIFWSFSQDGLNICRSPFDSLRANGAGGGFVYDCPFVLSLSKHDHPLTDRRAGYVRHLTGFLLT
jgi:hypothetical protein